MKKLTQKEAIEKALPVMLEMVQGKKASDARLRNADKARASVLNKMKACGVNEGHELYEESMEKLEKAYANAITAPDADECRAFMQENLDDIFGNAAGSISFRALTKTFGPFYLWPKLIELDETPFTPEEEALCAKAYHTAEQYANALSCMLPGEMPAENNQLLGVAHALNNILDYKGAFEE